MFRNAARSPHHPQRVVGAPLRPEDPRLNVVAVALAGTYPALTEEFSAGLF